MSPKVKEIVIQHNLDYRESRGLLDFALDLGADRFTITVLDAAATHPIAVSALRTFLSKIDQYKIGGRPFETGPQQGKTTFWSYNTGTRDLILERWDNNLLAHFADTEDLCIFNGERPIIEISSCGDVAFMKLLDDEYDRFHKLRIDHFIP
jgi:hypothetical protein